jgi:acetyl esterase/lipase
MKPSLKARIVGWLLRKTGVISRNFTGGPDMPARIAKAQAAAPPAPTPAMRAHFAVSEDSIDGFAVWTIAPKDRAPLGRLLYFHGGGYVYTASPLHVRFYANLAKLGIAVTAPFYPLAPEHGVEQTVAHALAVYRAFAGQDDAPFVLGGDSAGAGLAAVTAMAARDAGLRPAAGLLLIAPWLDATASNPAQPAIEARDGILRLSGIRDAGRLYARDLPVTDPRVSPINGDWAGLPPVLMFGGGDDILVTDARALKAKLPEADYRERAGLMHDWPIFSLRESHEAQAEMAAFVQRLSRRF